MYEQSIINKEKDSIMIKITVCNETETDKNEIYRLIQGVAEKSQIIIQEIPMWNEVTFLLENHTLIRLRSRDIYYFEYYNRKVKIVTAENIHVCIRERIGDIAVKMKKFGFAMSHQSYVVNLYQIDRITPQLLIMKNGDSVYLAQKRAAGIRKELRSQSEKILL